MTTETTMNKAAVGAYLAALAGIREALDTITEATGDHFGAHPDTLDWGNVGDANWVREALQDIVATISPEVDADDDNDLCTGSAGDNDHLGSANCGAGRHGEPSC